MKRIKATFQDIINLDSQYHDFYKVNHKTDKATKGCAYIFDNLTKNDREKLQQFKNVVISCGHCKYAPEIAQVRVILLNKCVD